MVEHYAHYVFKYLLGTSFKPKYWSFYLRFVWSASWIMPWANEIYCTGDTDVAGMHPWRTSKYQTFQRHLWYRRWSHWATHVSVIRAGDTRADLPKCKLLLSRYFNAQHKTLYDRLPLTRVHDMTPGRFSTCRKTMKSVEVWPLTSSAGWLLGESFGCRFPALRFLFSEESEVPRKLVKIGGDDVYSDLYDNVVNKNKEIKK